MNKNKRIILTVVVFLVLLITVALLIFFLKTPPPVVEQELNFEEVNDQFWMDLLPIDNHHPDLKADAGFIHDGALRMGGGEVLGGINIKTNLAPGRFVHVRMRTAAQGPCTYFQMFVPQDVPQEQNFHAIHFNGCPYNDIRVNAMTTSNEETKDIPLQANGLLSMAPDEWLDLIIWLHPDGDKFFYLAANEKHPEQVLYGAVSLPPEWQLPRWVASVGGYFGGMEGNDSNNLYTDVDFIRIGSCDLEDYLKYYFPGFRNNKKALKEFLKNTPPLLEPAEVTVGAAPVSTPSFTLTLTPNLAFTPTSTATPPPTPTATLSVEMQEILAANERHTSFTLYDDFETSGGALDTVKWITVPAIAYTSAIENGALTVVRDSEIWGLGPIYFEIPPNNFPEAFNALGVDISSQDREINEMLAGAEINLTDGATDYSFRCELGFFRENSQLNCMVIDSNLQRNIDNFDLRVPWYITHTLQMEWLSETGQMLVFHNGQLLGAMQVENIREPLYAETAYLFTGNVNPYANAKVQFDNLKIGSRRISTDIETFEDLIPSLPDKVISSTHNLDFILYDDFSNPLYENSYSQHSWNLGGEQPFTFSQRNGVFTFGETPGTVVAGFRRAPEEVMAVQFDLLPSGKDVSCAVPVDLTSHIPGSAPLDYHCSIFQQKSGNFAICNYEGHLLDFSNETNKQYPGLSPLFPGVSNTLTMAYDPDEGAFYALINNEIMFDKIYISEYDRNIILEYGLTPSLVYSSEESGACAVDNFALGIPRENPEPLPSPTTSPVPEITASLPHSDLYLLDDFDDPKFDTIYNIYAWRDSVGGNRYPPFLIIQEDGTLARNLLGGNEGHININQSQSFLTGQVNAFQIDIAPDVDDIAGEINVSIDFLNDNENNPGVNYGCLFHYHNDNDNGGRTHLRCDVCYPESEQCDSVYGWVEIPFGPHTIAIEFDPETQIFYSYLDGDQINNVQLPLQDAPKYQLKLHLYGSDPVGRLHFDDAMLGIPADHPELLVTPAAPYPEVELYSSQ